MRSFDEARFGSNSEVAVFSGHLRFIPNADSARTLDELNDAGVSGLTSAYHFRSTPMNGRRCRPTACLRSVESRCGAVALGRTYLLPPLSSGGALVVPPWLRFHIPLIEPDRQISRIRLSDKTSRCRVQRHLQLLNIYWSC